jgi:Fic family protein
MGIIIGMKPKIKLTHKVLKLISQIDEFKGRWSATHLLAPDRFKFLKHVATIESIGSSTRIEGVKLTDLQIEKLLSGLQAHSFRTRDEEEVAGYAAAMELIFSSFTELTLTENHIKQLHSVLLKFSHKDSRHRGEYKKFPNNVEAFDSQGKSIGVIFKTISPFKTPTEMTELVTWTNENLENENYHPLLVVATFGVHFLAIHPFQDGNGRLSRVLTTLLLLRLNYSYMPYSSLERVIEANKENYYLALRRAKQTLFKDDSKLGEWLLFFLQSMAKQKENLESKLDQEILLNQLSELSSEILVFIKDRGRATIGEIVTITNQNRNTVKVHLRDLVQKGYLVQKGIGKGTWYALNNL